MRKTLSIVPPFFTALVVAGCASSVQPFRAPEPRPLGRDPSGRLALPAESDSMRTAFEEPKGSLSLRDAFAAALINNPELAAYSYGIRAREAEALQAGLRPNPELEAELENFAGEGEWGGFRAYETSVSLSQIVELGGKRKNRQTVARYERDLAVWDYEMARIDVLTETKHAFIDMLGAQEQFALTAEMIRMAEEVLASVSRRVEAGAASPVERSRAAVELETNRIARDRAARSLAIAGNRLSAVWGSPAPTFSEVVGNLEDVPSPPPLEALRSRVAQNPVLARHASEIDRRRTVLELERSLGAPDLTLGAGVRYSRETENAAFVVGIGLPLPIFDRKQGSSRAAAWSIRRAEEENRAANVRIHTELAVLHEELLAADSEVRAVRERALPEAEAAFRAARNAYLHGSLRLTDVLDTERLFFELKSRYFDALVRYHRTLADMEWLVGESITTIREEQGRPRP